MKLRFPLWEKTDERPLDGFLSPESRIKWAYHHRSVNLKFYRVLEREGQAEYHDSPAWSREPDRFPPARTSTKQVINFFLKIWDLNGQVSNLKTPTSGAVQREEDELKTMVGRAWRRLTRFSICSISLGHLIQLMAILSEQLGWSVGYISAIYTPSCYPSFVSKQAPGRTNSFLLIQLLIT